MQVHAWHADGTQISSGPLKKYALPFLILVFFRKPLITSSVVRLLDAEWVSSPVVEAAQDHLAAVPEMDLGAPHLSPPLSPAVQPATEATEVTPGERPATRSAT
ncbi:hypothetical protein BDZ97DRAFT_1926525 [Flammula alnicola]|nr:hypothetical protein BDZ97DRAFT_1926525 [Flammula alnicola]